MKLRIALLAGWAVLLAAGGARAQGSFINFEHPPQHPVDMSPDGATLAVVNLPDGRLEIFALASGTPVFSESIPVGVDPVTARFRTNTEVWVVNHVSDSVSVVDLAAGRVVGTIQTLDEPYDVVFAQGKAFVSCSQANAVQVFSPASPWAQTNIITIDGEDPRGLAVSPDGATVYAAIFESGNNSTLVSGGAEAGISHPPNLVGDPGTPHSALSPPPNDGGSFDPPQNGSNPPPPAVGLIVKNNGSGQWLDDNGGDWTQWVSGANAAQSGRQPGWSLHDHDLAVIDAAAETVTYATGLMNICMAVAVNPATNDVTVVGTDGTNEIRFEPVINGRFLRVNLATVDAGTLAETVADLNAGHLDYVSNQVVQTERDRSLGDPRGIVWNATGTRAYVTGMGSNNLAIIDASGARAGAEQIELGEGPTGIALDSARSQLYVLNRFESSLSVVSTVSETETARIPLHDASPAAIKIGRKHVYDTHKNSGLGHISCGSCHIDSRMDRLAWDLGDPAGDMKSLAGLNLGGNMPGLTGGFDPFHPMKGPMSTQTLQDIIGKEPFHWRGDRLGLEEFNPAFMGLQADDTMLTPTEMQEFEDFLATTHFPPNPFRNFDNTLSTNLPLTGHFTTGRHSAPGQPLPNGNAQTGLALYMGTVSPAPGRRLDAGAFTCVQCHTLPTGMGTDHTLVGSDFQPIAPNPPNHPTAPGARRVAIVAVDLSAQDHFKTPHIRNAYEKGGFNTTLSTPNRAGFGFFHDGSIDSLERFIDEATFDINNDQELAHLVAFVLSISGSDLPEGDTSTASGYINPPGPPSSDAHAAVGKQVTMTGAGPVALFGQADVVASMIALADRSDVASPPGRVDLVANGVSGGVDRAWVYNRTTDLFESDVDGETISPAALAALAGASTPLTYTVVARGTGQRIGIDRDEDGFGNRTEALALSDSADALSFPGGAEVDVTGGPLSFGPVVITAGPSAPEQVVVASLGAGSVSFTGAGLAITGADAADFAVSNSPSLGPVESLDSRLVEVVFDPATAGNKSATLEITTNDPDELTISVPLSGIALEFSMADQWAFYQ